MDGTIVIENILMNYIDFERREFVFSEDFVDLSNEKLLDYYHKKIEKTLFNENLTPIVNVNKDILKDLKMCGDSKHMIDYAEDITKVLASLGGYCDYIPNTNVMFVRFRINDIPHLGIIKLNFKELPKMITKNKEDKRAISLTQKQQFPTSPSKADEAIFINLATDEVFLIEKKFSIDGKKSYYLNEQWLRGEKLLTDKQKYDHLVKCVKSQNRKYDIYEDDMVLVTRDAIQDRSNFTVKEIVNEIFAQENIVNETINMMQDLGIEKDEVINNYKDLTISKFVGDDYIEIKAETSDFLSNKINITENEDGTVDIIIKEIVNYKFK